MPRRRATGGVKLACLEGLSGTTGGEARERLHQRVAEGPRWVGLGADFLLGCVSWTTPLVPSTISLPLPSQEAAQILYTSTITSVTIRSIVMLRNSEFNYDIGFVDD
jgi:hypothetical protein